MVIPLSLVAVSFLVVGVFVGRSFRDEELRALSALVDQAQDSRSKAGRDVQRLLGVMADLRRRIYPISVDALNNLVSIRPLDGELQRDYVRLLKRGDAIPPIKLDYNGDGKLTVMLGFEQLDAVRQLGLPTIRAMFVVPDWEETK